MWPLKRVDLPSSALRAVPPGLNYLTLTHLDVSHNCLTTLPVELSLSSGLMCLNASYNRLTSLPACLAGLRGIKHLDVQHNLLDALPLLQVLV
jgi:Leucine-rich repeat (LRR) protein